MTASDTVQSMPKLREAQRPPPATASGAAAASVRSETAPTTPSNATSPEGEYNIGSTQKLVYMTDQLGSVRDVLDATSGNLVQSYDYTPYGALARSTGSVSTDYQYAGLFKHAASGLNLGTYRVQDGSTGRWINRDPLREGPRSQPLRMLC